MYISTYQKYYHFRSWGQEGRGGVLHVLSWYGRAGTHPADRAGHGAADTVHVWRLPGQGRAHQPQGQVQDMSRSKGQQGKKNT